MASDLPPRQTRDEKRAANDARLLDAARAVFLERGYAGASMDRIAHGAGLTKGALYARFARKDDLFLELLRVHLEQRAEEIGRIAQARPEATFPELARALAEQWMSRSGADAAWGLVILEFRVHAARDAAVGARYRALHDTLRAAVAATIRDRPPAQTAALARAALSIGNGMALEQLADPDYDYAALYAETSAALARLDDYPQTR